MTKKTDDDQRLVMLAAQLSDVRAQITMLKTVESDLLAHIRQAIGGYRGTLEIDGRPILAATYRKTFNEAQARLVLNDELIAACSETVISSSKAKAILAPAIYELCQVESAQPVVTPKIGA